MSRALGTVAMVAGVVALAATGVGAVAGAAAVKTIATAASVAKVATMVAMGASIASSLLQKKPGAPGNSSQILIGAGQPSPYTMGRSYIGGNLVHDIGYGGKVSGVENPYRSMVFVGSVGGPIDGFEALQADFETVPFSGNAATGYYSGFLWRSTQLGQVPEASALAGPHGAIPNWGAAYKLSGKAAWLVTIKHDKKGKVFASGHPQWGMILRGVRAYDPRKDSTYPGGSGSHRWDDESTWEWTENPALHALTYARGRYENGRKVFGCGFPRLGVDVAAYVELANLCDANGWKIGGTIYEPGSRWDNLKRILEVAAAEPVFSGALLSVKFSAPKVALDTITLNDLAPGDYVVPAMRTWRDRKNIGIPAIRSPEHKWEMTQLEEVRVETYVTEDGEEKPEEYPLPLCQDKHQGTQVTAYKLVNGREMAGIILPCKLRLLEYRIGEALLGGADLAELGLAGKLLTIEGREIDAASGTVTLTLSSETTAKHDFALGRTGTAPPTPSITTGEEMDEVVSQIRERENTTLINTSSQVGLFISATDTSITISNHTRRYADKDVSVTGDTITGLDPGTVYRLFYDDPDREGGAVTWQVDENYFNAFPSADNPGRHFAGFVTTAADDTEPPNTGGGALPPGGGGHQPDYLEP